MRVKRPNKLKCIRDFCLACAGDSHKEVSLCHLTDCHLWEYRTGNHVSSPVYKRRMATAAKNYPEDVRELQQMAKEVPQISRLCDDMKHG